MTRYPSVAGMFYPGDGEVLRTEVGELIKDAENKIKVIGLISPHAGYVYSGGCAGSGFGKVIIPGRVIILGVNHRGSGHVMAVDGHEKWNTPLGDIDIDEELREKLTGNSSVFGIDTIASEEEHSLEVQVPFIQILNPSAKILPITIGTYDREMMKQGGIELGKIIKESSDDILIIASTDMSHYISADNAKALDYLAIAKIIELDPDGLFDTVHSKRISMCGVSPTYIMMTAAKELGGTKGEVIEYTNSGYVSGDFDQVVGYLSACIN